MAKRTKREETKAASVEEAGAKYYDAETGELKPVKDNEVPVVQTYTGSTDQN